MGTFDYRNSVLLFPIQTKKNLLSTWAGFEEARLKQDSIAIRICIYISISSTCGR